jgi:UDP-N-acetylglucosamine 4,6-dehydratase
MNVLITGGTGTIGREITRQIKDLPGVRKIMIFSRDEAKHAAMMEEFPEGGESGLRYFIGDICDYDRLRFAMRGVNVVIHAAAMKHIDRCEYNPIESIRVNITGSVNVVRACIDEGVKNCMFISTDKACNPVSAYGAQKYAVERMMIGANNLGKTQFNCVRYGNVMGSRGSFIEKWEKLSSEGKSLNLTDADMTRFFWSISEAAKFVVERVFDANEYEDRGVVYIPILHSKRMMDIALTYTNNINITGLRCPEKIHEELISKVEALSTFHYQDHYIIYPMSHDWCRDIEKRGKLINDGFTYIS